MFLPMTAAEVSAKGWAQLDFILVTGDAYVDHPAFGAAIIGRVLEAENFAVGVLAQPRWDSAADFRRFGRPRLGFLITSGNVDSMVNNYTAAKRRRRDDQYAPGGRGGRRPDRAAIVYAQRAREAFSDTAIILGGIEASLRRLAHYDYWDDAVRRSILLDAKADFVVYGMAEKTIVQLAKALAAGRPPGDIDDIPGTVLRRPAQPLPKGAVALPAWETVVKDPRAYAESFKLQLQHADALSGKALWEPCGHGYVVQNPPALPLSQEELDAVYDLPFTRSAHPSYDREGGVPGLAEVRFSLASSRGCFGACSFCAIGFHQGRVVRGRSQAALLREAKNLTMLPDFKGYIHDVGGPTANFRQPACTRQERGGACSHRDCLGVEPCPRLRVDHREYIGLLRRLRRLKGIKKVFIRSGIRYDYVIYDKRQQFLPELAAHHVSGQLKVAPEHVSPRVLQYMGKPGRDVYDRFVEAFQQETKKAGKTQYLIPYFISSHPGSTLDDAIMLAEYIRDSGQIPEQTQDFYPTPGTLSTCMYYTGLDPRTMEPVYVPRDPREKAMQRALIHFNRRHNATLVREALKLAGRDDLIGFGPRALVAPERSASSRKTKPQSGSRRKPRSKKTGQS